MGSRQRFARSAATPSRLASWPLRAAALVGAVGLLGCEADPAEEGLPEPEEISFPVTAPAVPRLTSGQFENAIHSLFGDDIVVPRNIEPDLATGGLVQIGVAAATISPRGVEKYEEAAYEIAAQVVDEAFVAEWSCPSAADPASCASSYLDDLASRAWRRPPTEEELAALVGVTEEATTVLGDFFEGLQFGIAAIVQSPNFLFRVELGEPDPDTSGVYRYTDLEMASRLAFLLWNTLPDDELYEAARNGELTTDEGLRAQAERMLADPRAREGISAYFDDLYSLHELDSLSKDPTVFPEMAPELGVAARTETLMTIDDVIFERDEDVRALLTSRRTFLDRRLAALYDVRAPAREGFAATELPADQLRRGLLGQASLLLINSHSTSTSATLRGKFVREMFLCGEIPAPPSGVDTSIPMATETARTLRQRVARHLEDDNCSSCHSLMDPLGLALENFDGLGVFRTLDNGEAIDASGSLDGADYEGFDDFIDIIAADPRYTRCFVQTLFRYATSTHENPDQLEALEPLHEHFALDGFRFQDLVLDLIMSPAFRQVGEVQ